MAKDYERSLYEVLGDMRQLSERVGSILLLVAQTESLLAAIKSGYSDRKLKEIADVVQATLDRAKQAIG